MAETESKKVGKLLTMGLFVIVLMICLSWSFRASNFVAGTFRLDSVRICEELDDNLEPVSADKNMPAESQQVCLWFQYSKARNGDSVEISWYLNEHILQRETVRLSQPKGTRAFYLLREDGSALESGFYTVFIACNGKERGVENFTIAAVSGDVPAGNVIIWD
jgi:hypothetical protein